MVVYPLPPSPPFSRPGSKILRGHRGACVFLVYRLPPPHPVLRWTGVRGRSGARRTQNVLYGSTPSRCLAPVRAFALPKPSGGLGRALKVEQGGGEGRP